MTGALSGPAVALTFALAGAVGYAFGAVLEAVGAHRTAGTIGTLRSPVYLAGVALDLLAWLASLVALRSLPVYQVQAVLAASLAITVLLARLMLGARLRAIDLVAVAVTVVGVTVLAASSGPQRPVRTGDAVELTVALAAVPVLLAGWATVRWAARPALSAALAGIAYGGTALCARMIRWPADPWPRLAEDPLPWALAGYAVAGTLLYAHALEHGGVGPVTAVLWIVEVVVPSAVGWVVLGDTVRSGWVPAVLAAFVAVVAAAGVLANAPAYGVSQVTAGTVARGSAPD